jgi:GNAT superfamily N-acetyltransferase
LFESTNAKLADEFELFCGIRESMMPVTVHRCEMADEDRAWEIVCEYCDAIGVVEREDRAAFTGAYFEEATGIWLAFADKAVVGCIALRWIDAPDGVAGRCGEVKRLYVQPAWRGHRIAHLLLDALHEFAQSRGYAWLYLDSKDDLKTAIRFYRERGYEECPRYNANPQATVFLRRRVGVPINSSDR